MLTQASWTVVLSYFLLHGCKCGGCGVDLKKRYPVFKNYVLILVLVDLVLMLNRIGKFKLWTGIVSFWLGFLEFSVENWFIL